MRRLGWGVAIVALLVVLASWAIIDRDAARRSRASTDTAARSATLLISGGVPLSARSDAEATTMLAALIADRGSAAGVRLAVRPLTAVLPSRFAAVDVDARGSEASLLALARLVEGQRPIVRFVRWSIMPAGGSLRLEARAVALWARRQ